MHVTVEETDDKCCHSKTRIPTLRIAVPWSEPQKTTPGPNPKPSRPIRVEAIQVKIIYPLRLASALSADKRLVEKFLIGDEASVDSGRGDQRGKAVSEEGVVQEAEECFDPKLDFRPMQVDAYDARCARWVQSNPIIDPSSRKWKHATIYR